MADFFSPLRARIGGSPDGRVCWLGCQVALPAIHILPVTSQPDEGPDILQVELIVDGRWVSRRVSSAALQALLAYWRADPERTLKEWFQCNPPTASSAVYQRESQQSLSNQSIAATAEELDL